MYGQGDTRGKAGFVTSPVSTNQAVLALVPDESKIIPRYLLHAIRSQTAALRARAVGGAQPNLSKALILSQAIPVPESLEEQQILATAADALREQELALKDELETARNLRTALVSTVLTGQIEVREQTTRLLRE